MSNTTKTSTSTSAKKDEEKPMIAAVPAQGQAEENVEIVVGEVIDNRTAFEKAKAVLKNKKALVAMTGAVVAGSLLLIVRLRNNAAGVETEVQDETTSA